MRNKSSLLLLLILAACATTDAPVAPERKLEVAQVGQAVNTEFVACLNCPERTTKVIAMPVQAAPAPRKAAPEVQKLPEPKMEIFKVHFRWGWATLDTAGRQELALAAEKAKTGSAVLILGRTDPTGSLKRNERLAQKRAETIRKELVAAGVPDANITVGTHKPCCDGDRKAGADVHREQRRADVEINITPRTKQ